MIDKLGEIEVFVGNLEIGMRVTRLDRLWEETDFLLQGFVIENEAEIHSLRRQCDAVLLKPGFSMPKRESFVTSLDAEKKL